MVNPMAGYEDLDDDAKERIDSVALGRWAPELPKRNSDPSEEFCNGFYHSQIKPNKSRKNGC